jgi:hypothetical protein
MYFCNLKYDITKITINYLVEGEGKEDVEEIFNIYDISNNTDRLWK